MPALTGLVISAAGDFGAGKGNEQLRRWVEANGGRWMPRVANGITHLICTKDAWKKRAEPVKQAKERKAFIVSYDWLEDSLVKRRKLKEERYTWKVLRDQRRTSKTMKRLGPKADEKKFRQGCERACEDTGSGTSSRNASSRPSRGGFFASSLEDLARSREKREAEEKAREAKAAELAEAAKTLDAQPSPDQDGEASQTASIAVEPKSVLTKSISKAQAKPQLEPPQESASGGEAATTDFKLSMPTPSIFPACLKYTPPSPSQPTQPASPTSAEPSEPPKSSPLPAKHLDQAQTNKFKDLYHVYLDNSGFNHHIICLRINPYLNNFAQYDLSLYESNTKPHVYCTYARYKPPVGSHDTSIPGIAITPQQLKQQLTSGTQPPHTPTAPPSNAAAEAEKARLRSLIEKPHHPQLNRLHRALLAPLNSDFASAYRAFRHAFRDLTLLTWEERLDDPKSNPLSIQRLRAKVFNIEPFIWSNRPKPGMPIGVMPAFPLGDIDQGGAEAYVVNRWSLPALDVPLGTEGAIGSALHREALEARRRAEEARKRDEEVEKRRMGVVVVKKQGSKPNYKKPLFNAVSGSLVDRPVVDLYEGKPATSPGTAGASRQMLAARPGLPSAPRLVGGSGATAAGAAARPGFIHRPAVFTNFKTNRRPFPGER